MEVSTLQSVHNSRYSINSRQCQVGVVIYNVASPRECQTRNHFLSQCIAVCRVLAAGFPKSDRTIPLLMRFLLGKPVARTNTCTCMTQCACSFMSRGLICHVHVYVCVRDGHLNSTVTSVVLVTFSGTITRSK